MKSDTRVISPDPYGNGGRETGNAVFFMLYPLWGGARCGPWHDCADADTRQRLSLTQCRTYRRFARSPG
jgi:hypothetical protein